MQLCILQKEYEEVIIHNKDYQRKLDAVKRDRQRSVDKLIQISGDRKKALENEMSLKTRVNELEHENQHLIECHKELRQQLAKAALMAVSTAAAKMGATSMHLGGLGSDPNISQVKELTNKGLQDIHIQRKAIEPGIEMDPCEPPKCVQPNDGSEKHTNSLAAELEWSVAFASSSFSAMLSTLVAVIAWEAQDPCTPLVFALFIVVVMSLANVVQIFSKIHTQQSFHAVSLLSFNCFLLGTLAYPASPYLGQLTHAILHGIAVRFLHLFASTGSNNNVHISESWIEL